MRDKPWNVEPYVTQERTRTIHYGIGAIGTGVGVLGSVVKPGFVMGFLPLVLATACQQVRSIHVERVVDVGTRRMQLQRKVGVGLSVEGFQRGANEGSIGHVGLRESLFMIADTMGWRLDDATETLEPLGAGRRYRSEYFSVDRGYVRGLRQSVRGGSAGGGGGGGGRGGG